MSTRVWRDSLVKLSNQKLVFTQLTGLNVGDKTRNFTFQLVLQHNVSGQLARFCCLFKGQPLLHDFSSKVSCIFWLKGKNPNAAIFTDTTENRRWTLYAGQGIADFIKLGLKYLKASFSVIKVTKCY